MYIQSYSRNEVLPLLPLLHQWCVEHLHGFPYYYAPPKEQLVHPFDTVYVNEEKSLVVTAKENEKVIGLAVGVSLAFFYLDYNVSYVFSPALLEQFKQKGFNPGEVLYMGYFLMAKEHRDNKEMVLKIFQPFVNAAKRWGKKFICYIEVLHEDSQSEDSPEPYGTIIKGFKSSNVMMYNHSWPTLQSDGSFAEQNHDMTFYILDIS